MRCEPEVRRVLQNVRRLHHPRATDRHPCRWIRNITLYCIDKHHLLTRTECRRSDAVEFARNARCDAAK